DILSVTFRDAGVYECQVSNSPKVSLPIRLIVLGVQEADIIGPREVYIQHGSTISLHCEVQAGVEVAGAVLWLKGSSTLNYSSPRGGISMEVEKTPTKTMSKLYITRAVKTDSGNYTCAPVYALPDSVKPTRVTCSVPSPRESPALYPAHVSHLLCTQPTPSPPA
ncbi:hypothetical protein OTU49_001993, partial [Cherax quadricarinatus]